MCWRRCRTIGATVSRRALQLGLRSTALEALVRTWTLHVEDITPYVASQRELVSRPEALLCPREEVYPLAPDIRRRLGMDPLV